ncbi:MAG: tetratricopeptide repeat protein [Okeania sp. SIO1H6]|nr:tetratricopeptide repeat protein [Okeania sp. SIO1H6]
MQANQTNVPIKGSVKEISEVIGLFDDMWVGKELSFTIKSEYPIQEIELEGYLSDRFPEGNKITLKVGKETKQISSPGNQIFNCSIPVNLAAYQKTKIEVVSEKVFSPKQQGLGDDQRDLGFILVNFNIKRGKTAGEYLLEGKNLETKGEFEAAMNCYKKAISLNPKFHWSYYKLGEFLVKQGKYQEAIPHYRQAVKLNPNSTLFLSNLEEAVARNKQREQATNYHKKVVNFKSSVPKYQTVQAKICS